MVESTAALDDDLAKKLAAASTAIEEDFDESEDTPDYVEEMRAARDVLYRASVMFRYLSDEDFCKNITKRERANLDKLADQCFDTIENLSTALTELEEEI